LAAVADIRFAEPEMAEMAATKEHATLAEFDFLLACCRQEIAAAGNVGGVFGESCTWSPQRWDRALALADHHRVFPAVYAAVENRSDVPAWIRNELEVRFKRHARQTLRLSAETAGILRKFRDSGIDAMPHKGAVQAQRLFGDPAMRQFGDLDFLVREADVARARIALEELGYQQNLTLSPRQENEYLRAGNEYVFGCDQGKNLVELQWQILPRFYSVPFDMEALFSRSVETEFEAERVRVLRNEDLMMVLCAHAAKHRWEHLGMVRDIARLASFDLDWEWIDAEARRLGILRIVTVSLLLVRNLLRRELPQRLRIGKDSQCEKLADTAELRLRAGSYSNPESLSYFRSMAALRERWRDRVWFGWRLVATPNVSEWESVSIPDRFSFLYRGVRAVRLVGRLFG